MKQPLLYNYPEKDFRIEAFNILMQNGNFTKLMAYVLCEQELDSGGSIVINDYKDVEPRDDELWNNFKQQFSE